MTHRITSCQVAAILLTWSILCLLPDSLRAQTQPGSEGVDARIVPGAPTGVTTGNASMQAKQVRIECEDPEVKAAFRNFSDNLQSELLQLLNERDDAWAFPLEIHITGTPNDVVEGATAVIPAEITLLPDGNFQLRLYVRLHNRYDQTEVDRRFIQLMLYEMMIRPFAGKSETFTGKQLRTPFWLVRGIDELIKHRSSGRPSGLFAGIVNSRDVLSVAEILEQSDEKPLDPVTDAVFGACSAALIAALLDQKNGTQSFHGYLESLTEPSPSSNLRDASASLRQHFPGLRGSPGALEKWWSLQIASMGQLQGLEFFTAAQTEAAIDKALTIDLPEEVLPEAGGIRKFLPQSKPEPAFTGRLHDFDQFLDHKSSPAALSQCRLELRSLSLRAFPLYRSVILRYEQSAIALAEGKTRGIEKNLKAIDSEREGIRKTMGRVEDYLNFFEATQAEGRSEAYDQYREMKQKLESQPPPVRNDRISKYLDALELEFQSP